MKNLKVCAGASAGGHMNELLVLLDHSSEWVVQPQMFVTTLDILAGKFSDNTTVHILGECNRYMPLKSFRVLVKTFFLAWREQPDVVITTGAMPMALFCLFAKIFKAKIVWIDSIANIDKLSLSGALVRPFADMFITQWQHLENSKKNIRYFGNLV